MYPKFVILQNAMLYVGVTNITINLHRFVCDIIVELLYFGYLSSRIGVEDLSVFCNLYLRWFIPL